MRLPICLCMLLLMSSSQAQLDEQFDEEEAPLEFEPATTESPPMKSDVIWTKEEKQQVAVGTRWSMMIYAVEEKFNIDFSINGDSSVLYISFMFDEGEISINSLRGNRWDCLSNDRFESPVGTREKFFMDVTLEERGFHIVIDGYWHEFYYHKQPIDYLVEVIATGEGLVELTMGHEGEEDVEGQTENEEENANQEQTVHVETDNQVKEGDDGDSEIVDPLSDEQESLLKSMLAEVQQKVDAEYGRETLDGVETENVIVDRVLLEDLIAYFKNDRREEQGVHNQGDGNYIYKFDKKYVNENYVK